MCSDFCDFFMWSFLLFPRKGKCDFWQKNYFIRNVLCVSNIHFFSYILIYLLPALLFAFYLIYCVFLISRRSHGFFHFFFARQFLFYSELREKYSFLMVSFFTKDSFSPSGINYDVRCGSFYFQLLTSYTHTIGWIVFVYPVICDDTFKYTPPTHMIWFKFCSLDLWIPSAIYPVYILFN